MVQVMSQHVEDSYWKMATALAIFYLPFAICHYLSLRITRRTRRPSVIVAS